MQITSFLFGSFRLDGGAMFGSVPKNLWNKKIPADAENCIPMVTRSLLIETENRKMLVDAGMGEKWSDKERLIYAIKNTPVDQLPFRSFDITDVLLTHLHFDHAGGISYFDNGTLKLTYPQAIHYLQEENLRNASVPGLRERASYLLDNVSILDQARLTLVKGHASITDSIQPRVMHGHTRGLQAFIINTGQGIVAYPSDLIPTAQHVSLPWVMGYDMSAVTVLEEKADFLSQAVKENWLLIFEHDATTAAAYIKRDEKGNFIVSQSFTDADQLDLR